MIARAVVLLVALLTGAWACGARGRPAPSAVGDTHVAQGGGGGAEGGRAGGAAVAPVDQARVAASVNSMTPEQLARVWPRLAPGGAAAGRVALRLALVEHHRGRDREAQRWLARAGSSPRAGALAAELARARAARAAVNPARIAVLLPLTGPHARLGRELRVAIEVAGAAAPGARLTFVDTGGDADRAARAVDQAARAGAVGILGPVGQGESRAAAARAVELGLPIALLAPDDAGAAPAAGVFRLWPSPAGEAREAARLALALGYDRPAVLYPRDEEGRAQAEAFRAAAQAGGARVVRVGGYDPTARDLEPDVKAFLGLDPATNQRLRRYLRRHGAAEGWKTFSPDVDFDLLYVPDEVSRAALVVAYLPYFNVELRNGDELVDTLALRRKHGGHLPSVVQLLGSSGWYDQSLLARGGDPVQGALLAVPCVVGDEADTDAASEMAQRFTTRAGHPPGPVVAQAHDAALVMLAARAAAAAAGSRSPRAALTRALGQAGIDDGACGPAHMTRGGQLDRPARLLQVDGSDFTLFEP